MKTIFFDIDTQNDFILKEGRLPVPGAVEIIDNLEKLTNYARKNNIPVVASVDKHFGLEEYKQKEGELAKWGGPFPEHCMAGTKGQEKIRETFPLHPIYLENRNYSPAEMEKVLGHTGEKIIEKQSYDVFSNPNVHKVIGDADRAIVYGVATDYCVRAAVMGLTKIGLEVLLVVDAIAAVSKESGAKALREMKISGAKFIKTDEVIKEKI